MEIYIIDIWLEKIRRGWKIEDAPNEEIGNELRTSKIIAHCLIY